MHITIPVSPGELVDKITVLEIKAQEFSEEAKLGHVMHELGLLNTLLETEIENTDKFKELQEQLREINKSIWDSENDVREHWDDDKRFLDAARNSHHKNDERARVKREINELLGSKIIEEKAHPKYKHNV